MERLDKILVSQGIGSRREVQKLIKKKAVVVDGAVIVKPEFKIDPENCETTAPPSGVVSDLT